MKELRRDAACGRQYRKALQKDVVRLGLILDVGLEEAQWRSLTAALSAEELLTVREALAKKTAALFPPEPQLTASRQTMDAADRSFMI